MGKNSKRKQNRRKLLNQGIPAKGNSAPDVPGAFHTVLLRPLNSVITLRGKDPKQSLSDGQLLVTLDRYAVLPLEQYTDLLEIVKNKAGAVETAAKLMGKQLQTQTQPSDTNSNPTL